MKTSHRFVVTVAIVAVILISVFAAPTVARTTLAEAQARAAGTGGGTVPTDHGGDSASTLADDTNMTGTPTATTTSGQGSSGQGTGTGATTSGHQFVPYSGTPYAVPGRIEAENYDLDLCQQGTSGQGSSDNGTVTPTATSTITTTTTTTTGQGSSGQGSGNGSAGMNVTIISPNATSAVSGPNVTVTVQVTNFSVVDMQGQANVTGEGHLHYYMDVSPIPTTDGQPAIPNNTSAVWAHISATNYTFTNVTAGQHTFTVQLANNDHTPVIPIVMQSVTVQVGEAGNTSSNATGSSGTGALGIVILAAGVYNQDGSGTETVTPTATTTATTAATTTSGEGSSGQEIGTATMTTVATTAATATATTSGQGSSGQSTSGQPGAEPGTYTCAQGFAYFDRSPGNQGGAYRQDDVDIENGGSGHVVAFVKSSEWLIYSVNVTEAGTYTATFRVSSPWSDRGIWIWVDGVLKAQVKVPNTGSFDTYQDATATVALPAGNYYIRLEFVKDSQNLDYFTLEGPTGTAGGGQNVTPTTTSGGGNQSGGNVTPTPTVNVTDLTNQNSPQAAMLVGNQSTTMLSPSGISVGLQRVAGNFTAPLFVADAKDGNGRLFVVDQTGYVKIVYANGTVIDQPFLDVRSKMVHLLPGYDERGLLSIAFHPNFSINGKVYAYYSAPLRASADPTWNCTNHLFEFTVNLSNPNVADNATERILLEVDKPYMNHNGGILLFGPTDNYLYLTLGDGGRADDTGIGHTPGIGNAQDLTKLLGKIIRIDVDTTSAGKEYGIPADNPFLANATVPPEIYAYGFRNPAFASFDSGGSNRMFIAMAGQNLFESVLVLYRGGAYPWNIREGTHCFDPANNRTVATTTCRITSYGGQPLIGPVVELGHDIGNTVVGGVVYRGSNLSSVQPGSYLFGTWSNSFASGNGTLLMGTPPAGLDMTLLPDDAASLTPAENAMWTTSEVTVANNANGRINAFVRGLYETPTHEVLVLINQNPGPGVAPQNSGEVWMMVPATTQGLAPIGSGTAAPAPTPTATVTTTTATTTPTPTTTAPATTVGGSATVSLTAQNIAFDKSSITVPAGSQVRVTFTNMDSGVPHNFAVYTDASASTAIFTGAIVTGPTTTTYTFTAPSTPGTYFFRCDVHPTQMTGQFIVT